MPIRIEKDPDKGSGRNSRKRSSSGNMGSGGGGGGLGGILGAILPFLLKKPKLLILVAIIGGAYWFFTRSSNDANTTNDGGNRNNPVVVDPNSNGGNTNTDDIGRGADLIPEEYEKIDIYEPLADNKKNPLPNKTSLLAHAPKRLSQGSQGSCVGWASAYAGRTILHSKATGKSPNAVAFSPSYLYNNIALEGCQGTYIKKAMEFMANNGVAPFSKFGYNEQSCSDSGRELRSIADDFTIKGYNRLTQVDSQNPRELKTNMLAIKQNLAQGAPVVIGMMVGGTFMNGMMGQEMWFPTERDYANINSFGGHAMCVIGYDDYKDGDVGAFQIMNSWGEKWGDKGIFWVRYDDFDFFTKEAYGLYPMGDYSKPISKTVNLNIGAVARDNQDQRFGFQKVSDFTFNTYMPKQTRFKMEVTNSHECYIYVIGQEVDQSTYVLFPYTKKHSPYCGITGTRLFPNDYSLYPDDESNKDSFVIVASKVALDYDQLNKAISNSGGSNLEDKVRNAIGGELIIPRANTNNNTINLSFEFGNQNMVAAVIEVTKN